MSDWSAFPETQPTARITVRPEPQKGVDWSAFPEAPAQPQTPNVGVLDLPLAEVSQGRAAYEAALSGASGNWRDELYGLAAASGLPEWLGGLRIPVGAGRAGYEALTGQPGEASRLREEAQQRIRAIQQAGQQQYPGTSIAGEIGGAVVSPLARLGGTAAQGAGLGARVLTGLRQGATYGAISGAGAGETPGERVTGAATGGVVGGAVGAATPPLVAGVLQAGRAVARPVASYITGAFRPQTEAAKRISGALQRDIQADPGAATRLTAAEFAAAQRAGTPATIMDLGGETTRALARSAANTSPEGRAALGRTINERFEEQAPRLSQWLRGVFHFPNADAQRQALEASQRAVNNAAYQRAYRQGAGGVWSPELERLAGSDAVTAAMQTAARKARDEAIVGGYGAMNPRITFTPDGRIQFHRGPTGVPTYPDLQFWDLVRRELGDAGNVALRAGRGSEARRLNTFARALNEELDRLVPSYQQARQGAAAFFRADNALEAGENYVLQNFANRETRRALAQMSPLERQLFQDGFVSRLVETLERSGDRRNVLNTIANSPAAREKLQIALGPQRAAELEARLRIEGVMDMARSAVQGNSTTARQLAEIGFAGGAGGLGAFGTYNLDPTQMTTAALMGGFLAGRRHINQNVARHVAEMLTSNDPQIIQRGIQIVARNNRILDNLRATDTAFARVSAQRAPQPALQMPGTGRADEEQGVPRPIGQ
jgi:hypothetical protein